MQIIRIKTHESWLKARQSLIDIPRDGSMEVVIRKYQKKRNNDQNALYWAGPLKDMAEQAVMNGRKYSQEVWHEYFKREFLPSAMDKEIEKLVKNFDKYWKYISLPNGDRVLVGSTTDLTEYGFSQYLEQVYAFGAELGVMFTANPREVASYG